MTDWVRVKLDNGAEKSVSAGFAASHNLKPLNKPAADALGRPLRTKYPVLLRGSALDAALDEAGLSKSGTADEKRKRLEEHQASVVPEVGGETSTPTTGGESATSEEDSK